MKPNQSTQQYELDALDNAVLDLQPEQAEWSYDKGQELLEIAVAAADRVDDMDPSYMGPGPSLEYAQRQHLRYQNRLNAIFDVLALNGVVVVSNQQDK